MDHKTARKTHAKELPVLVENFDANEFPERQKQDALDQSHSKLIAAAFIAAQRLIDLINDENNRGYFVVQAVDSLLRIINRGFTDRENAKHI